MTEGERRFLREIAERVPVVDVVEAYLFPVLRQGVAETGVAVLATAPGAGERYAVLTARYSHAVKGMDRGAWTFDLHAEADAPLDALADAVHGVTRRAGDHGPPSRLDGDAFRAMVAETAQTAP